MGELFPATVYILCLVTSVACAILLGRSYARSRARLLLWSSICFWFLAANNLLLVLDLLVIQTIDLRVPRVAFGLAAAVTLIWGFVWDHEESGR